MKRFIVVSLLVISSVQQVFACSCEEWGGAKEMIKYSDFAVLAVPTEDSRFSESSDGDFTYTVAKTGMKIVKRYKGKYKKFFYLTTEKGDGANCGAHFKKYEGLFLIFGGIDAKGHYVSDSCSLGMAFPDEPESEWENPVNRIINELE